VGQAIGIRSSPVVAVSRGQTAVVFDRLVVRGGVRTLFSLAQQGRSSGVCRIEEQCLFFAHSSGGRAVRRLHRAVQHIEPRLRAVHGKLNVGGGAKGQRLLAEGNVDVAVLALGQADVDGARCYIDR